MKRKVIGAAKAVLKTSRQSPAQLDRLQSLLKLIEKTDSCGVGYDNVQLSEKEDNALKIILEYILRGKDKFLKTFVAANVKAAKAAKSQGKTPNFDQHWRDVCKAVILYVKMLLTGKIGNCNIRTDLQDLAKSLEQAKKEDAKKGKNEKRCYDAIDRDVELRKILAKIPDFAKETIHKVCLHLYTITLPDDKNEMLEKLATAFAAAIFQVPNSKTCGEQVANDICQSAQKLLISVVGLKGEFFETAKDTPMSVFDTSEYKFFKQTPEQLERLQQCTTFIEANNRWGYRLEKFSPCLSGNILSYYIIDGDLKAMEDMKTTAQKFAERFEEGEKEPEEMKELLDELLDELEQDVSDCCYAALLYVVLMLHGKIGKCDFYKKLKALGKRHTQAKTKVKVGELEKLLNQLPELPKKTLDLWFAHLYKMATSSSQSFAEVSKKGPTKSAQVTGQPFLNKAQLEAIDYFVKLTASFLFGVPEDCRDSDDPYQMPKCGCEITKEILEAGGKYFPTKPVKITIKRGTKNTSKK